MSDLQSILTDFVRRAGITGASLDVSSVTGWIGGISIAGRNEVRSAVEAITQIFQIDTLERNGSIVFRPRNNTPVASLTESDLIPQNESADSGRNLFTITKAPRQALPQRVELGFYDRNADYQANTQSAERQVGVDANISTIDSRMVLTPNQARGLAETLLNVSWSEIYTFSFALSRSFAFLETGDVVTMTLAGRVWTARILKITINNQNLDIEAISTDADSYQSTLKGSDSTSSQQILLSQPATLYALNLPVTVGVSENPAFFVATGKATGDVNWRYTQMYRSDGGPFGLVAVLSSSVVHGTAATVLPVGSAEYTDKGSTVNVTLIDGTLSSVTEEELLNGANAALLGSELIQFQNATLLSGTTWQLSTLLRGRNGTEAAVSGHSAGEVFLLLTSGVERSEIVFNDINRQTSLKGVSNGQLEANITAQTFTPTAANLRPYSPVHITAARDVSGNITLNWKRRTRYGGAWVDGQDVPLAEASESYEVDVLNGATIVRTLVSNTPSVAYTAAQQTADFGSLPPSVSVKVYQLSAIVGRGSAGIATV